MTTQMFINDSNEFLNQLSLYLHQERYGPIARHYYGVAKRFLEHLDREGLTVYTVQPCHVDLYIISVPRQRRSSVRADLSDGARSTIRSAIHLLLRLIHGQWPPPAPPQSEREAFHQKIIGDYERWMDQLRGLCVKFRSARCAEATRFLGWLDTRGNQEGLSKLAVADIDLFVQWRTKSLKRSGIKNVTVNLRSFLRYLFSVGLAPDLASTVVGPRIYALEDIPTVLRADEIEKVLQLVRQDRTPTGLRDYAILVLLTTYGLRAGEITQLCLDDIDWRHDRLRIRHSKTAVYSELPLLCGPGEAILDYLRDGRPTSTIGEVFLRAKAPYRALKNGSSLYSHLGDILHAAGVTPQGRRGPHAFRHARAVGLLEASVPLKIIGEILGHRSTQSTLTYLKLDLDALRDVALEIPEVQS